MIAIDTNVLVRLLVNDDEAQGSRARAAFEAEDIWIGKTVLLETFWVLRSVYDFDDTAIARAIEGALGLPRVQVEDSERVKLALAAVADRIDIADALHVAVASFHKIDYLVTWNFGHLANVRRQARIRLFNTAAGFFVPMIVTPEFLVSEGTEISDFKRQL